MSQKTTLLNTPEAVKSRKWHLINADGIVLGRMATKIATLLRGKHKPAYTDWTDCGDFVVVTNAALIKLTGNKLTQKQYFSHSGWAKAPRPLLFPDDERDPRKVVFLAVKRMIRANRLRGRQLARLKIYNGDKHPHAAQGVVNGDSK